MKKLIALLFAFAFTASAVEFQQVSTVTITNAPTTNGVQFIFNGDTRTGTNALSSTTFATNTTIGGITTNLYRQIIRYPFSGVDYVDFVASNQFKIYALPNIIITNTIVGDWASISISSNNIGELTVNISVPAENWPDQEDATNAFTQLVEGINTHSTSYVEKLGNVAAYGDLMWDFVSRTNLGLRLKILTEPERDLISAYSEGFLIFNETVSQIQYWDGVEWETLQDRLYPHVDVIAGPFFATFSPFKVENLFTLDKSTNSSLSDGVNYGVDLGTNAIVNLTGASATAEIYGFDSADTTANDVRFIRLTGATNYTIFNNSGDPTTANRIITGTGGSIVLTNSPAWLKMIYNADSSRFEILFHSN